MISFVNAKINIGLNIVGKRDDGYHLLESVFYPVGVYNGLPDNPTPFPDILEITFSNDNDKFIFSGNAINCPVEQNLVVKALRVFRARLQSKTMEARPVNIHLEKNIPDGAGLGGGSADASFTLQTLNQLYSGPFSRAELSEMAETLGADCPFFISNTPALIKGIGERIYSTTLNLAGYWCIIVKPPVYISTKEAFAGVKPTKPTESVEIITAHPIEKWVEKGLKNDFEKHIFEIYPELSALKEEIWSLGADYASMSGSGSSIFGIFKQRHTAESAYRTLIKSRPNTDRIFICKL